jgi:ubiquinone/menaquinone biosynthesis C-methylase UbiE
VDVKFDPARLARLNDPTRTRYLDIDLMWKGFGAARPRVVVDLGAGTGFFAVRFAPFLSEGGRIYACDVSDVMVDWMRANLTPLQTKSVIPLKVAENSIELPDGSVDLFYMINVYHEIAEPSKLLAEARRLLRPEAPIAIVDWKKQETSFEGERHGPPVERRVEPEAVIADLAAAGLTDVRRHDQLPLHFFLVARASTTSRST